MHNCSQPKVGVATSQVGKLGCLIEFGEQSIAQCSDLICELNDRCSQKRVADFQGDDDELASSHIEALCEEGMPLGHCADLLSALHHYLPPFHGQLRQSWRLLSA